MVKIFNKNRRAPAFAINATSTRMIFSFLAGIALMANIQHIKRQLHGSENNTNVILGATAAETLINTYKGEEKIKYDVDDKKEEERQNIDFSNYDSIGGEEFFEATAKSFDRKTDKVTDHSYQVMYGQFLLPFYRSKPNMKMLEIGLGCDMNYGPGVSVNVWKKLFPEAELWEADYHNRCINRAIEHGQLDGIRTLTGDQGRVDVLDRWIEESGGDFDVVIDDGGHQNCQIYTTFLKLWPLLRPGGYYFIEDIQVGRVPKYQAAESPICEKGLVVADKLKDMIESLAIDTEGREEEIGDIKFIMCQKDACVLKKS